MNIEFTFIGEPVPAVRMTQNALWRDDAQEYLGYKKAVIAELQRQYPESILPIPSTLKKKERRQFLSQYKEVYYHLDWIVMESRQKGDEDNYLKTIQDIIQGASFIVNDKKIKTNKGGAWVNEKCPYMWFKLSITDPKQILKFLMEMPSYTPAQSIGSTNLYGR